MTSRLTRASLRRHARSRTLFPPGDLMEAIRTMGFVQIDPLRAPARAQDLILRHRVQDYRDGDLGRAYGDLPLIEDFVHVQGVLPAASRRLLHPRTLDRTWHVEAAHPKLAGRILGHIGKAGPVHPRDLARTFGRIPVVNGWGGQSRASTRMLEVMHYRGHLHVVRRVAGVKVYDLAPKVTRPLTARNRMLGVLRLLLRLYAPLPMASLRELLRMAGDAAFDNPGREKLLASFVARDEVAHGIVDGLTYVWPADDAAPADAPRDVRFLAPFDPLVWDRRRFAHLHGWDYRFEAYTPVARRRFGYYALPLAFGDNVLGWANVTRTGGGVDVSLGFAAGRPAGPTFTRALDEEIARLTTFFGGNGR